MELTRFHTAIKVPLASTRRAVRPSKKMPPHTTTKPVMQDHVTGSATLSTRSPDSVTSVTCAQCEHNLIREEHRAPMVNLPIVRFSAKCQSRRTVLACFLVCPRCSGPERHNICSCHSWDTTCRNTTLSGLSWQLPLIFTCFLFHWYNNSSNGFKITIGQVDSTEV